MEKNKREALSHYETASFARFVRKTKILVFDA